MPVIRACSVALPSLSLALDFYGLNLATAALALPAAGHPAPWCASRLCPRSPLLAPPPSPSLAPPPPPPPTLPQSTVFLWCLMSTAAVPVVHILFYLFSYPTSLPPVSLLIPFCLFSSPQPTPPPPTAAGICSIHMLLTVCPPFPIPSQTPQPQSLPCAPPTQPPGPPTPLLSPPVLGRPTRDPFLLYSSIRPGRPLMLLEGILA
ncbi:hypothetical protein SLA2020_435360 [Shorea laevis]